MIPFVPGEQFSDQGGDETSLLVEEYERYQASRGAGPAEVPAPDAGAVQVGRWFTMTVVAKDPSIRSGGAEAGRQILRARVRVPADRLWPGPRSHRFQVVDYDATAGELRPPVDLSPAAAEHVDRTWTYQDRYHDADDRTLLADPAFHAQNVYAIAARTLGVFEQALGRPVAWGFRDHQLYLVPHAFEEPNAYYAGEDHALYFGYFEGRGADDQADGRGGERVYTCLAHDIVAHETAHALLDGLRRRYDTPGLPDQAAFHEALADIVAMLSLFALPELLAHALGQASPRGRIPAERVAQEALARSVLFELAAQMGRALRPLAGRPLRHSILLAPTPAWKTDLGFEEPHRRGEVLVAAVLQTLLRMWTDRLQALVNGGILDRDRAAEEGATAATHLLRMAIRSIDYCPPLDFELADFLDAILVSDAEVAPDDEHGYRDALRDAFAGFGIEQSRPVVIDLVSAAERPVYRLLNFDALRVDCDEVFRFVWQNAEALTLDRRFYTFVDEVAPSVRVGPDGFVIRETVATYVQSVNGPSGELRELSGGLLKLPAGMPAVTPLQLWGGGVLVFDQFGRLKYHLPKRLADWDRQSRRLAYLVRHGLRDSRGRLGFSTGTPLGQRFALAHALRGDAGEAW